MVADISKPIVAYIHFSGPGPNAARGNTVAWARRSITRKKPTSAAATASRTAVAMAVRCTPATLTASAAAPSSSSDDTGIRVSAAGAGSVLSRAGSAPGTSTAIATVAIAIDPKAQRQIPNWANTPPIAGPMMTLTPHIADTRADARVHSRLGRAALITAYPRPASNPPAAPCTVRATSSISIVGETAHPTVPAPNSVRVSRYEARGPNRMSNGLTAVAATTEPTRYTVTTHA